MVLASIIFLGFISLSWYKTPGQGKRFRCVTLARVVVAFARRLLETLARVPRKDTLW
jgi:hypothetical protein